ncbi:unnamed protein product [Ambrosiozyma monospora]|uniref:Unnamed protein product n=1 Tax=Ambrosiozyma monospora TaxID=43982 RepID=A0ACB5UCQ6_AMBMO|nr:unnamed protein product [Ambrosiozyma monospora]
MSKLLTKLPHLSTSTIIITSFLLRLGFLLFGLYQDKYMALPYTDIDYFVFTDASKFVYQSLSPYLRATYRYTPLLSWLLYPTALEDGAFGLPIPHAVWFEFGKLVFVFCDLITGILILKLLKKLGGDLRLSLLWFWNPMVITISTRGSSESLMTCVVLLMIWFIVENQWSLAGIVLGLGVHLKIYPLIYLPAVLLVIDPHKVWWKCPITVNRLKRSLLVPLG